MLVYVRNRLLLVIPTFLGITLVVFFTTRLTPGGPLERYLLEMKQHGGEHFESSEVNADQLTALKEHYGFDQPLHQAYLSWLGKILLFDFGESLRYGDSVWLTIKSRLPVSLFYGLTTTILVYLICIPLGICKVLRRETWFDYLSSFGIFLGYAVPGFVIGLLLLFFFASWIEVFPLGGFVSGESRDGLEYLGDVLYHAVLPLVSYLAGSLAFMTILMKNSLLKNLREDYVKTALAKGLSYSQVVRRHVFRNSLIPLASGFGNNLSLILAGSFLIEKVFDIDGMGLLAFESLLERDYPVVLGILVISSLLLLIGNILSDLCVALVDPRVRFEERA